MQVRAISFFWPVPGVAGGSVVLAEIDGELAQDFAGGGVDDRHIQVLDEKFHVGSGEGIV